MKNITYIFTLLFLISCQSFQKNESNLSGDDIEFIQTQIQLDEDEKIELFFTNGGGLNGVNTAGNFITSKRAGMYWVDGENDERYSIEFSDIDSIKLVDRSQSLTYISYIDVFSSKAENFKLYVGSDSSRSKKFYNELKMKINKVKK